MWCINAIRVNIQLFKNLSQSNGHERSCTYRSSKVIFGIIAILDCVNIVIHVVYLFKCII